jgi:hypothetical protein
MTGEGEKQLKQSRCANRPRCAGGSLWLALFRPGPSISCVREITVECTLPLLDT